jgi:hypothetical protein
MEARDSRTRLDYREFHWGILACIGVFYQARSVITSEKVGTAELTGECRPCVLGSRFVRGLVQDVSDLFTTNWDVD